MVLSFLLAGWMIFNALGMFAGSVANDKKLQSYFTNEHSSRLYEITQRSVCASEQKLFNEALKQAQTGQSEAPANPLFNYLEAITAWKSGNMASALKAIDAGNAKGVLVFYAPENIPPDRWQWPEVRLISGLGIAVVNENPDSKHALITSLIMGHKLVWSDPPDIARILHGIHLRKTAAEKLLLIVKKENDPVPVKLCRELIDETTQLENAVHTGNISDTGKGIVVDSVRVLMASEYNKRDPRMKDTAMLMMRVKQTQIAGNLRKKYLHTKSLGVLEVFRELVPETNRTYRE